MSAIANFYLLDTAQLGGLRENATISVKKSLFSKKVTDNYWDYLASHAKQLKSFDYSGYIYANLLIYLEDQKHIDLIQNEYGDITNELVEKRGSSHFILTNKQKAEFIHQLDPSKYSLAELQQFNEEFSGDGDEETARLTLEAIQLLHDNLSQVENNDQVLLLIVG